jgi:hypothetical protein
MPGNVQLESLIAAVERLDTGELLALSVSTTGHEANEVEIARSVARRVAAREGKASELERLKGEIATWAAAGGARAGIYAPDSRGIDVMLEDLRHGAAQAIFDAATARLLGPALDPRSRDALCRHWDDAIG